MRIIFLQLEGFINGQHVSLNPIVDESDILNLLEYCLNENNKMIIIGTYGNMQLQLCFEIETKEIIAYDYEYGSKERVTYSLADLFDKMFPKR